MLEGYRKRVNIGVGVGILLQLAGISFTFEAGYSELINMLGALMFLAGLSLFIWGLCMYAKGKGRHWAWGFLGLFNVLGLIVLFFLKALPAESIDGKFAIDKKKIIIGLLIALAVVGLLLLYAKSGG
jgi:hypothetical protein